MPKKKRNFWLSLNSVVSCFTGIASENRSQNRNQWKIFGSVTSVQIARAIREQKGYEIDRRRIHIIDDVKELGTYKAKIDFGKGPGN